jgi:hypothetical protein
LSGGATGAALHFMPFSDGVFVIEPFRASAVISLAVGKSHESTDHDIRVHRIYIETVRIGVRTSTVGAQSEAEAIVRVKDIISSLIASTVRWL